MMELKQDVLSEINAIAVLTDMQRRSQTAARRLPASETLQDIWDGLVFSVAGVRVVTAMSEITEMLPYPDRITRVPGSKSWMRGLANVRGSLLPVIDLQLYLGAKAVVPSKASRILVVRMHGLVVGLLVPSVQGMRHFNLRDRLSNARMKGALGAYVYEAFSLEKEVWPVLNMSALTADPAFRKAAA